MCFMILFIAFLNKAILVYSAQDFTESIGDNPATLYNHCSLTNMNGIRSQLHIVSLKWQRMVVVSVGVTFQAVVCSKFIFPIFNLI